VNFLIKLEDAINNLIEKLLGKLKALIPSSIFHFIHFLTHLPMLLKVQAQVLLPKFKSALQHLLGFFGQYITSLRGKLMSVIMYLRSEEFKKADKKALLATPFQFARIHPIKSLSMALSFCILFVSVKIIFKNTETIIKGTKALRSPASAHDEEEFLIEIKNHKFEISQPAAAGGHGGASADQHDISIHLDIKIEAFGEHEKALLDSKKKILDDHFEALHLSIAQLPLTVENQKKIEEEMIKALNEDFKKEGYKAPIKLITVKQVMSSRPQYFRQIERILKIEDINLQLFLEDTHRNRQVSIDFSVLATNRNVILYLQDHQVELKDHISTNVEPIIPQLPVEEEGRMIIKDKLKLEINDFLEKNKVEGKILEIYIDYLMAS
jgi:hypothetical protein